MNPLEHFLTSCEELKYEIVVYFFSFVLVIGLTFVITKGICDFVEFHISRWLKKYFDCFDKK